MRRIIKRTVTVLTTIVWTISWQQKAPSPGDAEARPADDTPGPPIAPEDPPAPWEIDVVIAKEVEIAATTTTSRQMAADPPDNASKQGDLES
jgi:hypothetical protein